MPWIDTVTVVVPPLTPERPNVADNASWGIVTNAGTDAMPVLALAK